MKVNQKDYQVIQLLGKGKGGYSYLVSDGIQEYVLKQIHHEPCDYYTFSNKLESEIRDYHTLSKININLSKMIDVDYQNECILKEYIKGDTIYDKVLNHQMKETYYQQIQEICQILYKNQLNIDYYPTNFIVQDDILYYIDYECNSYMEEWNYENWGSNYWSKTDDFLKTLIGKEVDIIIDRPIGSTHPAYSDMIYPINYGYVDHIMALDHEKQDAYVLGVDEPITNYHGKIIAIIVREDDVEEKWVVAPYKFSIEDIEKQVFFCEQYFNYRILI
ncbi:MAG: hypothetical protein ACI4U3_06675 [Traorella sp.]